MKKNMMRGRLDFKIEVLSTNEENGIIKVRLVPDPDRYKIEVVDGKRCWYDVYDHILIPESVIAEAAKKMDGSPIYCHPPQIENSEKYVQDRIPEIRKELEGSFPNPTFDDKSEEFLESLKKDELDFVILSLDMANSTKLSTELPQSTYAKLITVLLFEISNVVPLFHGHILKYTGDGIIAYFPEPNFVSKNDLAIDCSLTLLRLVYHGLNPVLESMNFPKIDIRIGLDSGEAVVVTMGSPVTKQHKDIIGSVVSLACKIQSVAQLGAVNIGQATYQNLHVQWKPLCREVSLPNGWRYNSGGIPYKIYAVGERVRGKKAEKNRKKRDRQRKRTV